MVLTVLVAEARGLPAADKGGTSDPYAKVELATGKGSLAKENGKTKVIKKTLTPAWGASFELGRTEAGRLSLLHLLEQAGSAAAAAAAAEADADATGATLELTVFDEGACASACVSVCHARLYSVLTFVTCL